MEYKHKLEFDCAECNQKYKIFYASKEQVEFCPFCGESILKPDYEENNELLSDDELEDDYDAGEDMEW